MTVFFVYCWHGSFLQDVVKFFYSLLMIVIVFLYLFFLFVVFFFRVLNVSYAVLFIGQIVTEKTVLAIF